MRLLLAMLAVALAFRPAPAAPTTPEAFIAAIKSAIAAKSTDQLLALTYTAGMSDADKKLAASADQMLFAHLVTAISLGPLPDDFRAVTIADGKKNELNAQPQGTVQLLQETPGELTDWVGKMEVGYVVIKGSYYLVGSKATDLGWRGPPDKILSLTVTGQGHNGLKVDVKWNASGVDQNQVYTTGSIGVIGQYFEKVTVTCADPDAELTLELTENAQDSANLSPDLMENGTDIVPPLKGEGKITYKK